MCFILDGTGPRRAGVSPGLGDLLLDLASDLLFRGPSLTRPGLRSGLTGYVLCWIHPVATMYVGDKLGVAGAGLVLRFGLSKGSE